MICLLGEVWTGPILSIPLQFSRFGSRNVLFDDGRMILHGCAARNSKNTLHLCISSNFLASQNETRSGTQSCLYIHIYLYNRKIHIPVYICSHIYVYRCSHTHTHTHTVIHILNCVGAIPCVWVCLGQSLGCFGPGRAAKSRPESWWIQYCISLFSNEAPTSQKSCTGHLWFVLALFYFFLIFHWIFMFLMIS